MNHEKPPYGLAPQIAWCVQGNIDMWRRINALAYTVSGGVGTQNLQQVTDMGSTTTHPITAPQYNIQGTGSTQLTTLATVTRNAVLPDRDITIAGTDELVNYIAVVARGSVNGVAPLNGSGLVPFANLPFTDPLQYRGPWNASTNTPTLSNGTGTVGHMYIVSVPGTQNLGGGSVAYVKGDMVVYGTDDTYTVVGNVSGVVITGTGYIKSAGGVLSYITTIPDTDIASAATWNAKQDTISSAGSTLLITGANVEVNLGKQNKWTAGQAGSPAVLTDGATISVDMATANNFRILLGGNRTLGVPTNCNAGQSGVISVYQDATGSRTLAYSWCYRFANGLAPSLSTSKFQKDQLVYYVDRSQSATISVTTGTPGLVTYSTHGLNTGDIVQFSNTGGALPTGLSANTTYWVNIVTSNTFNVATSFANLQSGTFVAITGAGSGTQTCRSVSITISMSNNIS